jgi:hypothetical protein
MFCWTLHTIGYRNTAPVTEQPCSVCPNTGNRRPGKTIGKSEADEVNRIILLTCHHVAQLLRIDRDTIRLFGCASKGYS